MGDSLSVSGQIPKKTEGRLAHESLSRHDEGQKGGRVHFENWRKKFAGEHKKTGRAIPPAPFNDKQRITVQYGCFLATPLKYDPDSLDRERLGKTGDYRPLSTMDLNENIKAMLDRSNEAAAGACRRR